MGAGGSGNSATGAYNTYDLVEQSYVLDSALADQQLASVTITTDSGTPLLLGATAVVPEPGTLWLVGLGVVAVLIFRRRTPVQSGDR